MNVVVGNKSDEENEEEGNIGQEGEGDEEVPKQVEENIFRATAKIGKRPKVDVGIFLGNINLDELIDQINELEEYFEYEDIGDHDRIKFAKAKMRGHAKWQEIQLERNRRGKEKITRWDCMVDKLKKQFIFVDYKLELFKNMQRSFIKSLLG